MSHQSIQTVRLQNMISREGLRSWRKKAVSEAPALGHRCKPLWLIALCLAFPFSQDTAALETDQYYAWGRELSDSTAVVNAKFNLEIEIAANTVNSKAGGASPACEEVIKQFHTQVHFTTLQEIEIWALKTDMLARVPADTDEELVYRRENLYQSHGLFDPSSWLPTVPTIEVNGIRMGTDKLAHFVSSGYRWYQGYLEAIEDGLSAEEAERHVVQVGLFWERTMLGGVASGATSLADLEANYQGMQFYYNLCHGADPRLGKADGRWVLRKPFDIREHVSPEWDESYNPPVYSGYRWNKVKPVLETYCDRLVFPSVQEQRRYYRSIDSTTAVEGVVWDLVVREEIEDPWQFSIEANCPPVMMPEESAAKTAPRTKAQSKNEHPDAELMQELYRRDTEVHRRTVGIAAAILTNPERVSGSFGLLFSQVPTWYDCATICSFKGTMIQLGAGVGGGRLSAGWGRVIGDQKTGGFLVTDPYVGLGFKGTFLYTWGDPWREPTDSAFLGGEVEFTIARVNLRAGVFFNVGGSESRKPWLFSGGIGWGF